MGLTGRATLSSAEHHSSARFATLFASTFRTCAASALPPTARTLSRPRQDGTVIEVFERVEGGIEKAHQHAGLQQLWTRYSAVCDFVALNTLAECGQMFANFTAVE